MKYVDPPFELGEKLQGVDADGIPVNLSWLGQVFFHPAQRLTGGPKAAKARFTGKGVWAVALRNISGIALQPKRLVRLAHGTAGASTVTVNSVAYNETNIAAVEGVDGYTIALAEQRAVLVDPFLASGTTVADNEIFWGVIGGRALCKTAYAGGAGTSIAVGAPLVAATLNTTTGNSTAGGVQNITLPGQTGATQAFSMAANLIGYALSARTTDQTDADILVDLCIKY